MWTAGPRLDFNISQEGTLPAAFNTELFEQDSATLADLEHAMGPDELVPRPPGVRVGLQTTSLNGIADSVLTFLANVRSDAQA